MSREFCRDVPDPWRCSKSLCKKTSCAFFVPYIGLEIPEIMLMLRVGSEHENVLPPTSGLAEGPRGSYLAVLHGSVARIFTMGHSPLEDACRDGSVTWRQLNLVGHYIAIGNSAAQSRKCAINSCRIKLSLQTTIVA